ncbi:MAG: hypothetical protein AAF961_00470, partial [Planctomycetota bacterium]
MNSHSPRRHQSARSTSYLALATFLAISSATSPASAEPLWRQFLPKKKVESNPNLDYHLSEDNGPWL